MTTTNKALEDNTMPIPLGMGNDDIRQWIRGTAVIYQGKHSKLPAPALVRDIGDGRIHVRLVTGPDSVSETFTTGIKHLLCWWPDTGYINVGGHVVHIVRQQQRQWRRSYSEYCVTSNTLEDMNAPLEEAPARLLTEPPPARYRTGDILVDVNSVNLDLYVVGHNGQLGIYRGLFDGDKAALRTTSAYLDSQRGRNRLERGDANRVRINLNPNYPCMSTQVLHELFSPTFPSSIRDALTALEDGRYSVALNLRMALTKYGDVMYRGTNSGTYDPENNSFIPTCGPRRAVVICKHLGVPYAGSR